MKRTGTDLRRQKITRILEQLETRRLLAIDVTEDHHDLLATHAAEYWLPPSQLLSGSSADPSTVSGLSISSPDFLAQYAASLLDHNIDSPSFRFSDIRVDSVSSATHVYLQQTFKDADVVNAVANFSLSASGGLVTAYSSFVEVNKAFADTQLAAITPTAALEALAAEFDWQVSTDIAASSIFAASKEAKNVLLAPSIARAPVEYEAVYVPQADGSLELAWRLNVQAAQGSDWLDASVSALDGDLLFVANWSSNADYEVFSLPKESPTDGGRTIRVNPQNATASPFGWHDTNGVAGAESLLTTGNNTNAYRDINGDNIPDPGSSPSGGAGLSFTPALDLTQAPASYADAAVVNAFYMTNALHDLFSAKGFDAASGNFQVNNYGAGGLGNDPLNAEVQDGSGTNNANMSTPPDGTSPRMQLFVWTQTVPNRDSALDNGVIIHEFGHGVTNRLTGGPANSSALTAIQSRGMGEGWSDFFALMYTQILADTAAQGRGIGTYVLGQPADGLGIRSQKYSYDMAVNTHTFGDIIGSSSVHFIGETWATTLWDLNWALIGGNTLDPNLTNAPLGFTGSLFSNLGGNNLTLRLVVQALKLQPANPTFLQARDAILAADQLLNNGQNQETIWRVFARRGMGFSALDGGNAAATAVTPAFDIPLVGTLDFTREGLLGSGISSIDGPLLPVSISSPSQISFVAGDGTTASFVVTPKVPTATLTLNILRANDTVAAGPFVAAGPGEAVAIAPLSLPFGTYKLSVSADLATDIFLNAAHNAALELQVGDTTQVDELLINNSFQNFGGSGSNGVVGVSSGLLLLQKINNAALFVDISASGTALGLSDDSETTIVTTVGNALFPAGNVRVGNNGGILVGDSGDVPISNLQLSSLSAATPIALYPFWDDIDSDSGNVYWSEVLVNGINTLIVQWENRPHFSNIGNATFQLQLFSSGPLLARFVYEDVIFGDPAFDSGASATIGFVSSSERREFSFNSPVLVDGDAIEIRTAIEFDEYEFNGLVGQPIDVAFDALGSADLTGTAVRLYSNNVVLASATATPLRPASTIRNYDLGILGYVLPSSGVFTVRVISSTSYDYYIAVTENLALDTENNPATLLPLRTLSALPTAMMGFLNASDVRDTDYVQLSAGQQVRFALTRPSDDVGYLPANTLAPKLSVIRPAGTLGAFTSTFNANGLMFIDYTALEAGLHRVDVERLNGVGEYHVKVLPLALGLNGFASPPADSTNPSQGVQSNLQTRTDSQPLDLLDMNGDGAISPLDVLLVINKLNKRTGTSNSPSLVAREEQETAAATDLLLDSNGDGLTTPLDALLIINRLNARSLDS